MFYKCYNYLLLLLFIGLNISFNNNHVESANILGLFPSQSKSHLVIQFAVVRALLERGHNITVVTTIPYHEANLSGYKHLVLPSETNYEDVVKDMIQANGTYNKLIKAIKAMKTFINGSAHVTLTDEFQKLMNEESFDLLLLGYIFNEFHLGLTSHFKCPAVVIWVQKPLYTLDRLVGNPILSLDYSRFYQMSLDINLGNGFLYHILNSLLATFDIINAIAYDYIQESYYETLFDPGKYPSYTEVLKNVSLVLINNHFSEGLIRANVPAFVEIGGIQVKSKPDPLPDDIKKFLDKSSKHGAILFSLGSNAKIEYINSDVIKNIYTTFTNLKQNIIWKWDSEILPGNSTNILFKNWLPQDDILAHPNLKLFITHGGKGSLIEAAYHGVPMVGIPLFADQHGNIREMVKKGFGVGIDITNLTIDSFENVINDVLTNEKYSKEVKYFSQIYRDRPMTAKESAIFWIEYVLRYNGAKHMQNSAIFMSNYKRLGIDVILFLVILFYAFYRIIKLIIKFLWRKCCRRSLPEKDFNKRKSKKEYVTGTQFKFVMVNIRIISIGILLIIAFINIENVETANILGLFTTQSKSHLIIHFAVVRALVERGHNVTVVTTMPYTEPNLTGFQHLVLRPKSGFEDIIKLMIQTNGAYSVYQHLINIVKSLIDVSSNVTLTDEFQKLMNEEKYDLLLLGYIFNEFHLGLSAHFNCPAAVIWVQRPFFFLDRVIGNPLLTLDYSRFGQMGIGAYIGDGFFYRILNFLYGSLEVIILRIYDYVQESYYNFLFPPDKYPSYKTMLQNISLLLVNHHFSEGLIRANVPAYVEIGGIQVKSKPDPLPDDIKDFLDKSSEHGAILFSLGSNVKAEFINPNATKDIHSVLSNLKQNVILKWETDIGNSTNILVKNWLPQDDILAHPNLKLFITHGGKGSLVEAAYHGVPTIGIPLFGDQPGNVNDMVKKGFGVSVNIRNLTISSFKNLINDVLTNETYTKNVKHYSELYRDRPMTAKENAIFWIEYVMRHKGAKHMMSPNLAMNDFERLGFDVLLFYLIVFYIIYRFVKFFIKLIWRKCCIRKKIEIVKKGKSSKKNKKE
ncbi:uncharacterized protein LOC129607504 [Condylostylus longicornis]|uniref:uncharacterized protein LOC129607504 n=1 Tax=Condylostylus longicornis TaxID=2530218 RepID=UPI00244DCFD8|nr:uncharacterized protein LOC129607504 [Condylostylus longicornis]